MPADVSQSAIAKTYNFVLFCVETQTMKFFRICGCCLCCLFAGWLKVKAQTDSYRPKIAEFSYKALGDYQTISNSETFGNASSEIEHESLLKLKLGIPLVIKDNELFGLQLLYYQHHFNFDDEDFADNYGLYNHLSGQAFRNLGLRGLYQYSLDDRRELTFAAGLEARGDEIQWNRNTTKVFVSGQYKKRVNSRTRVGYGAVLSRGLRLTSFYPIFTYEKVLSPGWTLDAVLPKSVALRKEINPKTYLTGQLEFEGWRYNLTNPMPGDGRDFTLRKADLELRAKFEREIHDWLWFGAELGYNKNVSYYLAHPGERGDRALIDLRARDARYLKFSIFIVPPRSLSR